MRKKLEIEDMKEGTEHIMNNGSILVIVEYIKCKNVIIEFIETGYRMRATSDNIRKGLVKDKLVGKVYNMGIIGYDPSSKHKLYGSWIWYLRKHHNKGIIPDKFLYFSDYVKYKEAL